MVLMLYPNAPEEMWYMLFVLHQQRVAMGNLYLYITGLKDVEYLTL